MLKRFLILSISVLISAVASASTTTAADSTVSGINMSKIPLATIANTEKKPKAFTLTLGYERGSDTLAESSDLDQTTNVFLIGPRLQINETLSATVKTFVQQSESGPRNTEVTDTQITLGIKGAKLSEELALSYSLNGVAPTSESNRKETRFQGAAGPGIRLSGKFRYADVSYGISYRRNVHEFTVAASGAANVRDVLGQSVTLEVPLFNKVSFSAAGLYRNSWTYQNSSRQGFSFDADLNYEPIKNLSLNVGTSNEGSALKANGKDSNVQFYDDTSSVIRAGVTYVF